MHAVIPGGTTPFIAQMADFLADGLRELVGEKTVDPPFEVRPRPDGGAIVILRKDGLPPLSMDLHPKQALALQSDATEILYGGSAGGGKSMLMRIALITWAHAIQGLQCYLFRRLRSDLFKNHMDDPGNFNELLAPWLNSKGYVQINTSTDGGYIRIGRSKIHLCHLQHRKYLRKYQGPSIGVLAMDELTHFERREYNFLRGRLRIGGMKLPEWAEGKFPRVLAASNPGSMGHTWVKANWIEPQPPMEVWKVPRLDGGMVRQFIPARLRDNPSLDEDYADKLAGLGDPTLVKAMLDGDWNIVAGAFFDDVWNEQIHVVKPFPIPESWRIDRSFDWGSSKPFSVGWWAESDGQVPARLADGTYRHFPRGTVFRIAEWYGWNGQPNEGLRLTDPEIARGILERETTLPQLAGRKIQAGPADSAIFDEHPREINGVRVEVSIAKEMAKLGVTFVPAQKGPGSRKHGWSRLRQMLKASMAENMEDAGLFVWDCCRQFIRTVPSLPRDENDPEDLDSDAEDHISDEVRYRCQKASLGMPRSASHNRAPVTYLPSFVTGW